MIDAAHIEIRVLLGNLPSTPPDLFVAKNPFAICGGENLGLHGAQSNTQCALTRAMSANANPRIPVMNSTSPSQSSRDINSRSFPLFLLTTVATVVNPFAR